MAATATNTNQFLEAALNYAAMGWRVVPLHWSRSPGVCSCYKGKDCPSPGKHPHGKQWQERATTDEETIIEFWTKHPDANVGIAMGEASGIVDFESDDEEQERFYQELFGDNPIVTCTFISSRGKHRLFRWQDDLPGGAVTKYGSLVVRTGNDRLGAMSVFPPSIHPSGAFYRWIVPPEECPPQPLPMAVVAKLLNLGDMADPTAREGNGRPRKPAEHWDRILDGVPEGSRDTDMLSYIGKLLCGAAKLDDKGTVDVLWKSVQAVNARFKPPIDDAKLRRHFLATLKKEENRRTGESAAEVLRELPDRQIADKPDTQGMELVVVRSDPPAYELHSKQFSRADGGCLVLTAEQLLSPRIIRIEALKQADYPLPHRFDKLWTGTAKEPGLYERLVFCMEQRDAPQEMKRRIVVAERLREAISNPRVLHDDQQPDTRGRPCRLDDGSIVFVFTGLWENLNMGADRITRGELSRVLEKIGVQWHGHKRWKRLTRESIQRLDRMIDCGSGEQ